MQPFKISLSALTLLALVNSCWGQGFYLGLGAGPQTASFSQNAHLIVLGPTSTTSNVVDTASYSGSGALGSLFAGHRWNDQKFFFATEANINVSSVEADTTNTEIINSTITKTTYKMLYSYGLSILPGLMYGKTTAFYLRLGYTRGNLRIQTNDSSLSNLNRYLDGICYGLGIDHLFSQQLGARVEVNQSAYQNTRLNIFTGTTHKVTDINPTTSQALLSLYYQFS